MPNFRNLLCARPSKNHKPIERRFSMPSKVVTPVKAVKGSLTVPGDKSISHRAVILASLSKRMCTVDNFLDGEDCLCTVEAFKAMDVPIVRKGTSLQIQGLGLDGLKAP